MGRFFELIGLDWHGFKYQEWGSSSPEIPLEIVLKMRGPTLFISGQSSAKRRACG
jgi:hypothetical protein